jgi:hypothetical protein
MPSSVLLLGGVVAIVAAAGLLWSTAGLRGDVRAARGLLDRARVAVDEAERVDRARRQLGPGLSLARGSATGAVGAGRMVGRSGQAIAGIPYAILLGIGRRRRGRDGS